MSRRKTITGTVRFPEHLEGDEKQFQHIFARLNSRFQAGSVEQPGAVMFDGAREDDEDAPGPAARDETAPFVVTLTFEEGVGEDWLRDIEAKLEELLGRLVDAAAQLPGRIGAGARLLGALRKLIADEPDAPELDALGGLFRDAAQRQAGFGWPRVRKWFQRWQDAGFGDLRLTSVTEARWKEFEAAIRDRPSPPADGGAGGPAGDGAPPADGGAGGDGQLAPAVPPPDSAAEPLQVSQFAGWLARTKRDRENNFEFRIDGITRYPDDRVIYGPWARFDVLGPDGSQLLTKYIKADELSEWLEEEGARDLEVDVESTRELRAAIEKADRAEREDDRRSIVKGRLWFSDGRPFGTRTLAVFVPPKFPKLIDDCCPPEGFLPDEGEDCCSDSDRPSPAILETPHALAVAQTDEAGYFEFSFSHDEPLTAAYALLHVSGLTAPLALKLVRSDDRAAQGGGAPASFPRPILLQVDSALLVDIAPGSGGAIDWIGDDDEDCCGGALNFGEPDRAIDEFKFDVVVRTTDPMVTRRRLRLEVDPGTNDPGEGRNAAPARFEEGAEGEEEKAGKAIDLLFRVPLSRRDPVEWDGEPLVALAETISHGRILSMKQVWRSDGYSLGDLRYSLPLAPLQKKNIAVVDWDRRDTLMLDTTQSNTESLYNFVGRERDISEIVNSALNESVRGRSESGSNSRSGGGGFSLFGLGFGGASAGSATAWSSSSQDSARSLAASFVNQLKDQTVQAANAFRAQRVTTVRQIDQSETATAISETVANRNACHAITVQYFEVLRHFRVDHELVAVRECLYIPLPIQAFTAAKALRWRTALEQYLPSPRLRHALDACQRLEEAEYPGPAGSYAEEQLLSLEGELEVKVDFAYPIADIDDAAMTWQDFFGFSFAAASPLDTFFVRLRQMAAADRPTYFHQQVAPVLARKLIESLQFFAEVPGGRTRLPLEAGLVSEYRGGMLLQVAIRESASIGPLAIVRKDMKALRIKPGTAVPATSSAIIAGVRIRSATRSLRTTLIGRRDDGQNTGWYGALALSDEVRLPTPVLVEEARTPAVEDRLARAELVRHLNEHVEFYHKAIWWSMDADRRFSLLDGYIAPNSGGRSVAAVVENRLAAIIGNCLVMPLAPGIHVDYFTDVEGLRARASEIREKAEDDHADALLALYRPLIPHPSTGIAIPTNGVFAESVMGSCNSCEKIDNSRNWQYWQHPLPDEPTAIEPVSLSSRAQEQDNSTPPLSPAIINQVQSGVPNAPDPTGLASAIAATAQGFPDAIGLPGTQQAARDALTQTYAATTRFGERAAEITLKQLDLAADAVKVALLGPAGLATTESVAKVKQAIRRDAAAGHITQQQAQEAIAKVNDALVDSLTGATQPSIVQQPEVAAAIDAATGSGASLSVTKGDARVEIGEARSGANPATSRGWRPFGQMRRATMASQKRMRIEIVTAIREKPVGYWQVGEKSRQILDVDPSSGRVTPSLKLGVTKVLGREIGAVSNNFTSKFEQIDDSAFVVSARGQTASGVSLGLVTIDYNFKLIFNPMTRQVHIWGAHDGFPSYTIIVDGKVVYDRNQSAWIGELAGKGDIEVDQMKPY